MGSSMEDMSWMFDGASTFNGDLYKWDTSGVTTMQGMFYEALKFDRDLSSWSTSSVEDMSWMFHKASVFNGDLSSWDTSQVTAMEQMFEEAALFNQSLCAWGHNFPYDVADDIFLNSGCVFQDVPQSTQKGPFCASSCFHFPHGAQTFKDLAHEPS